MLLLNGWFILALVLFFVGAFGSGLLIFSTWIIGQRFGFGCKAETPVYVDIRALIVDRIILNVALILCLMIEGVTLIWDSLSEKHFPIMIRWPIVALAIVAVCTSGLRIFRLYMAAGNDQKQKADSD